MPARASASVSAGFPPQTWGPGVWFLLHTSALSYPQKPTDADKRHYLAFLTSLQHVLPCEGCRKGYAAIVSSGPFKLTRAVVADRWSLFKWTVAVHNVVNAKVGKPVNCDWVFWYQKYSKAAS